MEATLNNKENYTWNFISNHGNILEISWNFESAKTGNPAMLPEARKCKKIVAWSVILVLGQYI